MASTQDHHTTKKEKQEKNPENFHSDYFNYLNNLFNCRAGLQRSNNANSTLLSFFLLCTSKMHIQPYKMWDSQHQWWCFASNIPTIASSKHTANNSGNKHIQIILLHQCFSCLQNLFLGLPGV